MFVAGRRSFELLSVAGSCLSVWCLQALWGGSVVNPQTESALAVDAVNKRAFEDPRTYNALLNTGDGTHVIFKK